MPQRDLESSQAYLAAIVESSDDAILSKDLDGTIRSFNAAAERLFGFTADEIIGRPITVLIPPDHMTEEAEILAKLRHGERIEHFETVRLAKDGHRIDVLLSVSPVRNSAGTITGAAKIVRDITERKRAAKALAAQQEWFRVTLGSIGDAVIASDPEGRITFMNAVAENLTGWKSSDASGVPLSEVFRIVNEKTRLPVENPAEKVIRTGMIAGLANNTVLISKDGVEWPIDDSAAPIVDDEKRVLGAVLVFHDVSEHRRAAAALVEQREWLHTTLRSIGDGVIATDILGKVVFMNPIAEHLTGWTNDGAKGHACAEVFKIVNEATRREVTNPVTRVLREGQVVGLANHTVLIAADGTERAIDDSGAPIRDASGKMTGVVLVFRDVSDRRRTELERQAIEQEREAILLRERQARGEAERANRVKDEFVAMVSHELRTPLSAILGWTQILQTKPMEEEAAHAVEVISRNARLQGQLISDLLDVSRMASDHLVLELETVDLSELIAECLDTVQQAAADGGITIHHETEGLIPPTAADGMRLKQVLCNLLTNAVKFTPRGGRIDVRLWVIDNHAEIIVTDTGVGIPAQNLPHIFERFTQWGPNTTRRYGGLGLGLAISKHLAELHGGSLRATSEGEGRGSTFALALPIVQGQIEAGPQTRAFPTAAERDSLKGITVLVVEDEADMRRMLKLVLEEHGAEVIAVESAKAALNAITDRIDILLSDIRMPEIDGYELMRLIRQREDGIARIPAVALTAFARAEDRARAMRAGFQGHVPKPFERDELVLTLSSLAEIVRSNRGAEGPN